MAGRKNRGHRSQKVTKNLYRVAIDGYPLYQVFAFKPGHAEKLAREDLGTDKRATSIARIA